MTDILDERPDFRLPKYWQSGNHSDEIRRRFSESKFNNDENAWLEKLRAYYDITTNSIQVYGWKEKAEKLEAVKKLVEKYMANTTVETILETVTLGIDIKQTVWQELEKLLECQSREATP